jgi:hypothetical protein
MAQPHTYLVHPQAALDCHRDPSCTSRNCRHALSHSLWLQHQCCAKAAGSCHTVTASRGGCVPGLASELAPQLRVHMGFLPWTPTVEVDLIIPVSCHKPAHRGSGQT